MGSRSDSGCATASTDRWLLPPGPCWTPPKLSWIDSSTIDVPVRHTRWEIQPQHYGRNLRCGGQYSFVGALGGHTTQHIEADLRVSWPLVGRLVERALLSGLRQHLAAEAGVVERFVTSR
jgi:hypothetical protein